MVLAKPSCPTNQLYTPHGGGIAIQQKFYFDKKRQNMTKTIKLHGGGIATRQKFILIIYNQRLRLAVQTQNSWLTQIFLKTLENSKYIYTQKEGCLVSTSKITNNLNLVLQTSLRAINYFIAAGSKEPIASLSVNESLQLMKPGGNLIV